jgi:protocatechuate 3,4-dioxygenase beta subunit
MKKRNPESPLSRREAASRMLVVLGGVVAYGCGGGDNPTGGTGGATGGSGGVAGTGGASGAAGSTGGGAGVGGAAGRGGSGGESGSGGAGNGGNGGGGAGAGGKGGTAGSAGSGGNAGGTAGSGGNAGTAGNGGASGTMDSGQGGAGAGGTGVDASLDARGGGAGSGMDAGRDGAAGGGSVDVNGDACATGWASGGTAAITGNYPDPFASPVSACTLITAVTEGPCTEAADQVRKDVSEGYAGLPVRLALKVVNSSCQPIVGAKVKIWHTHALGSYSGNTPNNSMCLKNQSDSSKHYFRGVQTTDDSGRLDFDTCFPGWYMGRCIHIHFTLTLGTKSYTSQIIFDQAVVDDICKNHVDYKSNGMPDTTNASDSVCGSNVPMYTAKAERMCDGVMLASKLLVVNV